MHGARSAANPSHITGDATMPTTATQDAVSFLNSSCSSALCRDASCAHATVQHPVTGRWFITMGHAQFNSAANNSKGYETQASARRVIRDTLARSASR
jgi:hypothetical protein